MGCTNGQFGKLFGPAVDCQFVPREIEQIYYSKLLIDPDNLKSNEVQFLLCLYRGNVLFYSWNEVGEIGKYHTLRLNDGASLELVRLSYTMGDYRFQMIFNENIRFYKLQSDDDNTKFEPVLENTMYNVMNCNQLLLSNNGKFAVSFKLD